VPYHPDVAVWREPVGLRGRRAVPGPHRAWLHVSCQHRRRSASRVLIVCRLVWIALSMIGRRSAPYSRSAFCCSAFSRNAAPTAESLNPSRFAIRWISALTMGFVQRVSWTVRRLATGGFCDRGVLLSVGCARMGIRDRADLGEGMRARVNARLSCPTSPCASLFFVGFAWFEKMF